MMLGFRYGKLYHAWLYVPLFHAIPQHECLQLVWSSLDRIGLATAFQFLRVTPETWMEEYAE